MTSYIGMGRSATLALGWLLLLPLSHGMLPIMWSLVYKPCVGLAHGLAWEFHEKWWPAWLSHHNIKGYSFNKYENKDPESWTPKDTLWPKDTMWVIVSAIISTLTLALRQRLRKMNGDFVLLLSLHVHAYKGKGKKREPRKCWEHRS